MANVLVATAMVLTLVAPSGADEDAGPRPFALVELFTSEGCSSCPPADGLLRDLARRDGVIALSLHVDYWDRLGWKDPFSDSQFSDRQRLYARSFKASRIYTPQMVVNGDVEFVGSDRALAEDAIGRALSVSPAVGVSARASWAGPHAILVDYDVWGLKIDARLNLALVEDGLVNEVSSGENAGRRLAHDGVVRAFLSVPLAGDSDGTATMIELDRSDDSIVRLVAYVQEETSMRVVGAATTTVSASAEEEE